MSGVLESESAFQARHTADAVLGPNVARALLATGPYAADGAALIESYGGGVYRVSTPAQGGPVAEFFRMGFNEP